MKKIVGTPLAASVPREVSANHSTIDDRSWIEIDLSIFENNLHNLKNALLPNQKMLLAVKADAYGHGAIQIAQRAVKCGVSMLGVANVDEAVQLRIHKITKLILIMSPSLATECELIVAYDIVPSVSEIAFCKRLNEVAIRVNKKVAVHLKIDSGMNRNGVKADDVSSFLEEFSKLKNLYIEGIFSHFAASDDDADFSKEQYKRFLEVVFLFKSNKYKHLNSSLKYTHIANSTALFLHNDSEMNMVRVGIMAYGFYLVDLLRPVVNLKPIMSFKSRVSHLGYAKAGDTIGYNRKYTVYSDTRYAIIPVGYADGYDFLLSNKGCVSIGGYICGILGKVSMDMLCVDITNADDVQLYDEVLLLGGDVPMLDAQRLSSLYGSHVYELLCQLGRRAQRYYFRGGKQIENEPIARRFFAPTDFSTKQLSKVIQQSITHRMQGSEISNVLYRNVLKPYISESDKKREYRSDFMYDITFSDSNHPEYYKVKTILSFSKVLSSSKFFVVCANDNERLQYFFKQKNCEYRWLLDPNLSLSNEHFFISKVSLNGLPIKSKTDFVNGCIVYRYGEKYINNLKGERVDFCIESETLYPRSSHSLTVYVNELTKGVEVSFTYADKWFDTDTTVIFSGRERFPKVERVSNGDGTTKLIVKTKPQTWVIPNSAIVISFKELGIRN